MLSAWYVKLEDSKMRMIHKLMHVLEAIAQPVLGSKEVQTPLVDWAADRGPVMAVGYFSSVNFLGYC